jgi:hypothetical protein
MVSCVLKILFASISTTMNCMWPPLGGILGFDLPKDGIGFVSVMLVGFFGLIAQFLPLLHVDASGSGQD